MVSIDATANGAQVQHGTNGAHPDATANGHIEYSNGTTAPTYAVALFNSKNDNQPKAQTWTWPQLVARLTSHSIRANKDGALWSPTTYKPDTTRAKANIESVSCFVADFDNGDDVEIICAPLRERGLAFVVHSSFSHKSDFPKMRVVFPFASPVAADQWPEVWERLTRALGGSRNDQNCKDASRIFYLPSCTPESSEYSFAFVNDGAPLDISQFPAIEKPAETPRPLPTFNATANGNGTNPRYATAAFESEIALLHATANGSRNAQLNRSGFALGQLTGAGALQRADVESALENAAHALGLVQDDGLASVRATIRSGLNAGELEPRQPPEPQTRATLSSTRFSAINGNGTPESGASAQANQTPPRPAFELFDFAALAKIPRTQWLVRGLLPEKVASVISADSGGFKSFFALDMGLCVAHGRPFMERETKRGGVVYVAAEGFYTLHDRATAWALHHDCELPENFHALKVPINLGDAATVAAFANGIESLSPSLVILDTLSQCAVGANENDNGQMADFVRGMMALCGRIGAHVTVLHHNGKASGTFRGAGAIKANVDAHISLERPEKDETNTVFVRCEKQRGKPFEAFALRGVEIELPFVDEYGDAVTSLVFEPCGDEVTAKSAKHPNAQKADKTRAALMEVFDKLAAKSDGVKIGTWKSEVEKADPPICSERTFWEHCKKLKDPKSGEIAESGTHNDSVLWARKQSTATTATTAKCSNCSNSVQCGVTYCDNCSNPLGTAVVAVPTAPAKTAVTALPEMPSATQQQKPNRNADSEAYSNAHLESDEEPAPDDESEVTI